MWSREKIIDRIYWTVDRFGNINPQQHQQVRTALQKLEPSTQFEILYTVLHDSGHPQPHYRYQKFAGELLLELRPPCPLDVREAIRTLATCCDRSVGEVPWYFAYQFGQSTVLDILAGLETEMSSERDLIYLSTWVRWIQGWSETRLDPMTRYSHCHRRTHSMMTIRQYDKYTH